MRQVKTQKNYTRKQLIADCVAAYRRNNPEQYHAVVRDVVRKRTALHDEKFGLVKDKDSAKNYDMRLQFSIPEKLFKAIEVLLDAHKQERFLELKGEDKWFATEFPQFFIPAKI